MSRAELRVELILLYFAIACMCLCSHHSSVVCPVVHCCIATPRTVVYVVLIPNTAVFGPTKLIETTTTASTTARMKHTDEARMKI